MLTIYAYTIISVLIVSAISGIGVITYLFNDKALKKITLLLVALSAGTLLGDAFLHLIPEAVEKKNPGIWFGILAGIIIFFILEKIIHWRHCHIQTSENHPHPLGTMNLIGDSLHNFIDGVIIAGSFMVSLPLGIATSIAVIAHEIPQEISDFGVLIHAGYSKKRALALNFLTALLALAGALLTLIIGQKLNNISDLVIPFTAGGFIYIATSDLIPELKKETGLAPSLNQLISILAGIGLMLFLKIYFQ